MTDKHSLEWFKERALHSIKKIKDQDWDFSDSMLLYVPKAVEGYEAVQEENNDYYKLITEPETKYIKSISNKIASSLPDHFNYIDLGPGTEDKSKLILKASKTAGKSFTYYPVDISEYMLKFAEEFAQSKGIPAHRIQSSFEECADLLPDDGVPRFVSLGMTFLNYESSVILKLLKSISGSDGLSFINAHIRGRFDLDAVQRSYQDQLTGHMFDPKIELLDLDPKNDIAKKEATDEIKVWYTLVKVPSQLKAIGMEPGDRLLVFQSIRYSLGELKEEIGKSYDDFLTFDTGEAFTGFLLKS